jgi:transcription initiation factor TFIIIB Brf1 subunit/transcription initiation factor TFIIB
MTQLTLPSDVVDELAEAVELPEEAHDFAAELAAAADYHPTVSRSPSVVAASVVYVAATQHDIDTTQQEIADAAQVSTLSISDCYQMLLDMQREEEIGDGGRKTECSFCGLPVPINAMPAHIVDNHSD